MDNEQPRRRGIYRWDGTAFRPAAGRVALFVGSALLVGLFIGCAIGLAAATPSTRTVSTTTGTAAPSSSAVPTPRPTRSPTPAPTPIALSGQGSKVLTVALAAGRYKVSWSAQGNDNFIVKAHGAGDLVLVNEIPPNPSSGETLLTVQDTGSYTLEVQAATLTWSMTLERLG